jgi:hypothetical protein
MSCGAGQWKGDAGREISPGRHQSVAEESISGDGISLTHRAAWGSAYIVVVWRWKVKREIGNRQRNCTI